MSGGEQAVVDVSMPFLLTAIFLGVFVSFITRYLPTSIRPPHTVAVFLLSFCLAALEDRAEGNLGKLGESIRAWQEMHPHIILFVLLPPLLFESALKIHFHVFKKVAVQAIMLAGPGLIISAVIIGVLSMISFVDYNWNLSTGLLLGFILSATDPVAVVANLHELSAPEKLSILIEGESLLNDGTAFVAFLIFKDIAAGKTANIGSIILEFFQLAFGGPLWGVACGIVVCIFVRKVFDDDILEVTAIGLTTFTVFFIAEDGLHVSGVLAAVLYGLYMANRGKYSLSREAEAVNTGVWREVVYLSNILIFAFSGVIIYDYLVKQSSLDAGFNWLSLLMLYVFIHVARFGALLGMYPILRRMGYGLSLKEVTVIAYGGLRGAIALALAQLIQLEEDIELQTRHRLAFLISGIVMLTLIVNGTTTAYLYKKLKLYPPHPFLRILTMKALKVIENESEVHVEQEMLDWFNRRADFDIVRKLLPDFSSANITAEGHIEMELSKVSVVLELIQIETSSSKLFGDSVPDIQFGRGKSLLQLPMDEIEEGGTDVGRLKDIEEDFIKSVKLKPSGDSRSASEEDEEEEEGEGTETEMGEEANDDQFPSHNIPFDQLFATEQQPQTSVKPKSATTPTTPPPPATGKQPSTKGIIRKEGQEPEQVHVHTPKAVRIRSVASHINSMDEQAGGFELEPIDIPPFTRPPITPKEKYEELKREKLEHQQRKQQIRKRLLSPKSKLAIEDLLLASRKLRQNTVPEKSQLQDSLRTNSEKFTQSVQQLEASGKSQRLASSSTPNLSYGHMESLHSLQSSPHQHSGTHSPVSPTTAPSLAKDTESTSQHGLIPHRLSSRSRTPSSPNAGTYSLDEIEEEGESASSSSNDSEDEQLGKQPNLPHGSKADSVHSSKQEEETEDDNDKTRKETQRSSDEGKTSETEKQKKAEEPVCAATAATHYHPHPHRPLPLSLTNLQGSESEESTLTSVAPSVESGLSKDGPTTPKSTIPTPDHLPPSSPAQILSPHPNHPPPVLNPGVGEVAGVLSAAKHERIMAKIPSIEISEAVDRRFPHSSPDHAHNSDQASAISSTPQYSSVVGFHRFNVAQRLLTGPSHSVSHSASPLAAGQHVPLTQSALDAHLAVHGDNLSVTGNRPASRQGSLIERLGQTAELAEQEDYDDNVSVIIHMKPKRGGLNWNEVDIEVQSVLGDGEEKPHMAVGKDDIVITAKKLVEEVRCSSISVLFNALRAFYDEAYRRRQLNDEALVALNEGLDVGQEMSEAKTCQRTTSSSSSHPSNTGGPFQPFMTEWAVLKKNLPHRRISCAGVIGKALRYNALYTKMEALRVFVTAHEQLGLDEEFEEEIGGDLLLEMMEPTRLARENLAALHAKYPGMVVLIHTIMATIEILHQKMELVQNAVQRGEIEQHTAEQAQRILAERVAKLEHYQPFPRKTNLNEIASKLSTFHFSRSNLNLKSKDNIVTTEANEATAPRKRSNRI